MQYESNIRPRAKKRWLVLLVLPPAALAALGLIFWGQLRGLTAAELLNYLPASVPLAALSLIGLHGLKSLSLVFPLAVLQVAGGLLLPTGWAFAVNLAGMLVSLSLPYGVGRFTGNQLWRWLCARFPRIQAIERFEAGNNLLFAAILRLVDVLPFDLVSWYLGSTGVAYGPYLAGSVIGNLADMVMNTWLGIALSDGLDWRQLLLWLVLKIISLLAARALNRRVNERCRKPTET